MVRPVRQRLAVVGIAVTVAGSGLAVASVALLDRPSTAAPIRSHVQPLTPRQVHQAVRAAAYFKAEPMTGATAISTTIALDAGSVQPGVDSCPSSGVVEVHVYGSFPHIVTSGRFYPPGEEPGPLASTVTSVLVDLDPVTGGRCAHAVETGPPATAPGSQLLFGHAP